LAGIKLDPDTPGFKRFIIKPGVVDDPSLKWVKAGYESLYGPILSEWEIKGTKFQLRTSVPPNTTATLYLPANSNESVTEG
jgi:hypothetical protein